MKKTRSVERDIAIAAMAEGHPGIPVSAEELAELIAQDYRGGKFSWR